MFTHSATQFEVSYPFEELKHIQTPREKSSRLRQILLVYTVGCVQFCSGNDDAQLPPLESVAMVGKAKTFRSFAARARVKWEMKKLWGLFPFFFAPIVARVENMKRIQSYSP